MKLGFESWVICRTHSHPRCVVWLCKLQKTGVYGIIKVGPATVTTVTAVTTTSSSKAVVPTSTHALTRALAALDAAPALDAAAALDAARLSPHTKHVQVPTRLLELQ